MIPSAQQGSTASQKSRNAWKSKKLMSPAHAMKSVLTQWDVLIRNVLYMEALKTIRILIMGWPAEADLLEKSLYQRTQRNWNQFAFLHPKSWISKAQITDAQVLRTLASINQAPSPSRLLVLAVLLQPELASAPIFTQKRTRHWLEALQLSSLNIATLQTASIFMTASPHHLLDLVSHQRATSPSWMTLSLSILNALRTMQWERMMNAWRSTRKCLNTGTRKQIGQCGKSCMRPLFRAATVLLRSHLS